MSFAGHVFAMIQQQKANRKLLGKRARLFSGMDKQIAGKYRHHTREQKHLSPEELSQLRLKLIREERIQMLKKGIALFLAFVIVAALIYWLRTSLNLEDFFV